MTSPAASPPTGPTDRSQTLLAALADAGYQRAYPPILQPAEPFLDLSGEDIRKSLYLTTDAGGDELCLRPDLTIPVARDYLASGRAGEAAGFCYLGPVFRFRGERPSEFLQAGVESFGRLDTAAADAEMLALALDAVRRCGVTEIDIRTGDVALFAALLEALELAPVWKRRLLKDFNRKNDLAADLQRMTLATSTGRSDYHGILAALAGSDRKAALALVSDLISIAGATNLSGRSNAEIADRFLEHSTMTAGALPKQAVSTLERFLAIDGAPREAVRQLRQLARDAGIDLTAAVDLFENRVELMAAKGLAADAIRFATAFGRGVDYYTGFEFELHAKGNGAEPLVAGGRYDGLLTRLGAPQPIPAVGFSIWIEALATCGQVS